MVNWSGDHAQPHALFSYRFAEWQLRRAVHTRGKAPASDGHDLGPMTSWGLSLMCCGLQCNAEHVGVMLDWKQFEPI